MTTEQWKSIGRAWLMPVMLLATLGLLLAWWFQEAGRLDWVDGLGRVQLGILASLVAGLFTLVGALPVLLFERISYRVQDSLLGFGAGVMLAATAFSLAEPAITEAQRYVPDVLGATLLVSLGIGLGGLAVLLLDKLLPHEHFAVGKQSGAEAARIKRIWLFIFAISIHNLPEGLAVGVGYSTGDITGGLAITIGIGLQNMPEGLIVAIGLMSVGYSRWTGLGVALLTGLVEPVGGTFGAVVVTVAAFLLPLGLAFAAGAMLFVISHEIIPESHRKGHQTYATMGVLVGFVLMMTLGKTLG